MTRPSGPPAAQLTTWRHPLPDRPTPVAPITPGLDRGTARRLGRGRIEPQARLDLHGMTADRAHGALAAFIAGAVAQGLRCVLVVTGKGMGRPDEVWPPRDEGRAARGEGVLRRETPRWLATPPLSGMVVGVFEAHPKHGGGGALYVYIRRRR